MTCAAVSPVGGADGGGRATAPCRASPASHVARRADAALARHVEEVDHLDYKLTINHRNPEEKFEARADCAALASAGDGYLVVGIRETSNGRNEAAEIVGLPKTHAADLKKSLEDVLGNGIDPPIATGQRSVWLVDVGDEKVVLVVMVKGRVGYPKSVDTKDGGSRFVVRQAGKKKPLTPAEARALRRELDLANPLRLLVGGSLVALLAVVALAYALWISPLRRQANQQLNELETARSDVAATASQLASANAALSRLTRQSADLEVRIRERSLDVTRLAEVAACFSGVRVALYYQSNDAEVATLVARLNDGLAKGGWQVQLAPMQFFGAPMSGLVVRVKPNATGQGHDCPPAAALFRFLQTQPVGSVGVQPPEAWEAGNPAIRGDPTFSLHVGVKQ